MADRDTKGDLYEYILGKIASAGQNGQFRTPRHIIQLIVELTAPGPKDVICDPACGTAGFLVAAGEYLRDHHPEIFRDAKLKQQFHEGLCCHATMKNAGKMLRREEIEFFLRLHGLWGRSRQSTTTARSALRHREHRANRRAAGLGLGRGNRTASTYLVGVW